MSASCFFYETAYYGPLSRNPNFVRIRLRIREDDRFRKLFLGVGYPAEIYLEGYQTLRKYIQRMSIPVEISLGGGGGGLKTPPNY